MTRGAYGQLALYMSALGLMWRGEKRALRDLRSGGAKPRRAEIIKYRRALVWR